jgi:hypothetical protein
MSDLPKSSPPPAEPSVDEFAGIPSRRARHPALALGAAALALFIVAHVRDDISYSLSSSEPLELGEARALFAAPGAVANGANRLVRLRGTPDRESALELDTKGSWTFTQFFRVLGTGNRLFVHRRENPLPASRAERDVFEGRLIRFGELSFESSIRSYSAAHVSATHFFRPDELRRALGGATGAGTTVRDLAGDPVALGPSDLLAIDLARPEEVRVGFPRDKYRDQAAARAEIEKRGGVVMAAAEPTEPTGIAAAAEASGGAGLATAISGGAGSTGAAVDRQVLLVRFPPEARQRALHELGELDRRVEIRDARQTFKVRLADLADGADALLIKTPPGGGAPVRLPLAAIPAIRTLASVQIPPDAWLLIEGDLPRDHLHTVIFGAMLMLFAAVNLINLIGLARGQRRS